VPPDVGRGGRGHPVGQMDGAADGSPLLRLRSHLVLWRIAGRLGGADVHLGPYGACLGLLLHGRRPRAALRGKRRRCERRRNRWPRLKVEAAAAAPVEVEAAAAAPVEVEAAAADRFLRNPSIGLGKCEIEDNCDTTAHTPHAALPWPTRRGPHLKRPTAARTVSVSARTITTTLTAIVN
jgi:hypothetical protein